MQLNYDLADRGVGIQRILIVPTHLWPEGRTYPLGSIRSWIDEQLSRGIVLYLVREGDLSSEQDLLGDFGIYGDFATGAHELDSGSRTVRFILSFDPRSIKLARDRWERLLLFATPYEVPRSCAMEPPGRG
jgi:hypothetical protein